MDFVTKTTGVKAERQQMKSVRCKKDVGARRDGERIGQRWMKRARGMCISICLHFIRPSVSISLCLSLSGLAHCPWLLRRSLTLMEFEEKEAREEQGKKKRKKVRKNKTVWGFIAVTPFPQCDVYCQHRLLLGPSARPPTHTHNSKIFMCSAHTHLNACTLLALLLAVFFQRWDAIIWITCCTAMSPPL